MKRAHEHREYRNVSEFEPPAGVVSVQIDPASGKLATASCPKVRTEYFIEGTQPVEMCPLHGGGGTQVASWETQQPRREAQPERPSSQRDSTAQNAPPPSPDQRMVQTPPPPKRKSLLDRLRSIFK